MFSCVYKYICLSLCCTFLWANVCFKILGQNGISKSSAMEHREEKREYILSIEISFPQPPGCTRTAILCHIKGPFIFFCCFYCCCCCDFLFVCLFAFDFFFPCHNLGTVIHSKRPQERKEGFIPLSSYWSWKQGP